VVQAWLSCHPQCPPHSSASFKSKGPERLVRELNLNGHVQRLVVKQGSGHAVHDGKIQSLALWVTQYQRADIVPSCSRLAEHVKPNTNVAYVGVENIGGASAYHIRPPGQFCPSGFQPRSWSAMYTIASES